MIPASFDYVRAESADAAVAALAEHGEDAKVLAGGHSLIPMMRLRLAVPEVLVDIGEAGLSGVTDAGDHLVIGAATTHHDVVHDPLVGAHCGVLAHVTATIGDPQVRHRGTIGGGLAHGEAAGDLPAALLALDGTMVVQGPAGRRTVSADDFFVDYLTTAVGDDELLVEIHVPKLDDSWRWNYQKFNRVAQAWATVGALALVSGNGTIDDARVGLTNMATVPLRAHATEAGLVGQTTDAIADAAARAGDDTDPPSDLNADPDFRRHLATVLARRALETAVAG